jgi:hypothetical protein
MSLAPHRLSHVRRPPLPPLLLALGVIACATNTPPPNAPAIESPTGTGPAAPGLWSIYDGVLEHAKHIDLTHSISPSTPIWSGFGPAVFLWIAG